LSFFDPFGLKSFLVSRPLSGSAGGVGSHNFVVTNANYIGDPNATVHSFGQNAAGNLGNVGPGTAPSSFSATTHADDIAFWQGLGPANPPLTQAQCVMIASTSAAAIPASDAAVNALAGALIQTQDYAAFAGPFGVNSNSAAQAIANTAAGHPVPTPDGSRVSPGARNWTRIRFSSGVRP